MGSNLYLVFSKPPAGVSAEEFDRWYAHHAQENIESPRVVSAQRYQVRKIAAGVEQPGHEHLALYEYEGTYEEWRDDLSRRITGGEITLPDWFKEIPFESFDCAPLGGRLTPTRR
jgi:hypothetical protein